eukprot:TRINITY_DN48_c3_g1_i1.p1 TRINITY_DN48_c3_g1~~TRINITY_DN48_c3_g1_i1.p1  ORF type:complete len:419 (+),score=113.79 TRINITY_DN48_c3_g1_i1:180-1259(+)
MGVDFMTPMMGVVAGTQNGIGAEIKRTTDGGKTWGDVEHENALMMYMCMAFTDTQKGVTAGLGADRFGASSAYTTDSGQSWTLTDDRNLMADYQDCEPVPNTPEMIVMPGFWEDIIGKSGAGVAISHNSGRDFAHHDWHVDTEPRYAAFGSSSVGWISGGTWPDTEEEAQLTRMFNRHVGFVKNAEGFLEHRFVQQPAAGVEGFVGVIAKTTDGGNTWTVQLNDTTTGIYFNGISAVDPQNVWAVAEGDAGAYIYHTSDGGAHWEQQLFTAGASMLTVKFFDTLEGWVAGAATYAAEVGGMSAGFWHTLDGGKTWELQTVRNYYVSDLDLLDREHVYATAFSLLGDSAILQYVPPTTTN